MNLKGSYDSRFYRISKIFVMFIIIFTIGAGYNNKIRLSESIMIIIICILLLFIQECINKIQKTDSKYKLCEQEYTLSIEAINGAIWIWDDKSNKVYVSNKIRELLGLEKEKITLEEWYKFIIVLKFMLRYNYNFI